MRANVWTGGPKLLVLGLLRTVSALATRSAATEARLTSASEVNRGRPNPYRGAAPEDPAVHTCYPPLQLRLARRSDVPSLQRCNLATLPENYNHQFYANHLREWPDLAFVAVDCSSSLDPSRPSGGGGSYTGFPTTDPDEKVVAYVLGKVEERLVTVPIEDTLQRYHDRSTYMDPWSSHGDYRSDARYRGDAPPSPYDYRYSQQHVTETERIGHVTSLAVLDPYRRRGLAIELMKQLHYHLAASYRVDAVGLHVRRSNVAAERLYAGFGYKAAEVIPGYYQDGEDAFFMKKTLPHFKSSGGLFDGVLRRKVWETGPVDLRLPRTVGVPDFVISPPLEEPSSEELLTGSM
jgi:ribosomal protein S18 acetylase RimI-like enzyme